MLETSNQDEPYGCNTMMTQSRKACHLMSDSSCRNTEESKENRSMKAVRLVEAHYPLQMQEIPVPTIGESDVLVRVRAAGICHSDVHYRAGKSPGQPLPRTLGHEIAGVVEQVGSRVTTVKVGHRICVHYVLSCGECSYCNSG